MPRVPSPKSAPGAVTVIAKVQNKAVQWLFWPTYGYVRGGEIARPPDRETMDVVEVETGELMSNLPCTGLKIRPGDVVFLTIERVPPAVAAKGSKANRVVDGKTRAVIRKRG